MELLGKFLGRYQLVRVLGQGAMGVVYEGLDPKLNRQVAVKTILKSRMLDPDVAAEYATRFEREARAAARLNHPNIVTVFDFSNDADIAYIVMEFIRGEELKALLDAMHVFSITEAVDIICDLLEALHYAHSNGVIHRDIKPANVMLDTNGRVKLTDFGVARLIDGVGLDRTRVGTMVGTLGYMSPEQIKGLAVGPQSDLFAVGVLLYQCLSLHKPFVGNSEWDLMQKIVNGDPPPLSTYRQSIPAALERVILSALASDPKNRPATARALIADLKAAVAGEAFDADATRMVGNRIPDVVRDESSHLTRTLDDTQDGSHARSQQTTTQTTEAEVEFWRSIKDSSDLQEFQLYLERFSDGTYAGLARRKISRLQDAVVGAATFDGAVMYSGSNVLGVRPIDEVGHKVPENLARQADEGRVHDDQEATRLAVEAGLEVRHKVIEDAGQEARRKAAPEVTSQVPRAAVDVAGQETIYSAAEMVSGSASSNIQAVGKESGAIAAVADLQAVTNAVGEAAGCNVPSANAGKPALRPGKNKMLIASGGLLVALLIGGGTLWLSNNDAPDPFARIKGKADSEGLSEQAKRAEKEVRVPQAADLDRQVVGGISVKVSAPPTSVPSAAPLAKAEPAVSESSILPQRSAAVDFEAKRVQERLAEAEQAKTQRNAVLKRKTDSEATRKSEVVRMARAEELNRVQDTELHKAEEELIRLKKPKQMEQTPEQACADRPNFISRAICERRECEKPEREALKYCVDLRERRVFHEN